MKPGDWVIVTVDREAHLVGKVGRLVERRTDGLFHRIKLPGESAWWDLVEGIRPATPEEIAAGQLARGQAGGL